MVPVATLVLLNLLAHFLPFERASLSLDSLARLTAVKDMSLRSLLKAMWSEFSGNLDRPFEEVYHYSFLWIVGQNKILAVALVFLGSSVLTLAVYYLMRQLLDNEYVALLSAGFYLLLPNKLDLYYTFDYSIYNMFLTMYVASFALFILFAKRDKKAFLLASLLAYTIGVFWYELGFFLPIVLVSYAVIYHRGKKKTMLSPLLFLVPAIAYVLWRTNAFGLVEPGAQARGIQFRKILTNVFVMVPNQYAGWYMGSSVVYGIYRVPTIELPWLAVMVGGDSLALLALVGWIKRGNIPRVDVKVVYLSAVMFVMFLFPALLSWGVGGRHTALASIGVAMSVGVAVSRWEPHIRKVLVSMLLGILSVGLIVSQSTAWSQVVAGRMNNAIFESLVKHKDEILGSDRVLIDQYSFASRIPYRFAFERTMWDRVGRKVEDQLDTYWGVAGLLGRGFPFLVHLAVGQKKQVYVVRSPIQEIGGESKFLRFKVRNPESYELEDAVVPKTGSVVIDYGRVYGGGKPSYVERGIVSRS